MRFGDAAAAQSRDLSGTVKITTEEVYAMTMLAPLLRELHEQHPEILIELDTSQKVRDLGAGEADISLRSTQGGNQPAGLVGRQLCVDDWALYCSRDYAARHGAPRPLPDLKNMRSSAAAAAICGSTIRRGCKSLGSKAGGDASRDVRRAADRASDPDSGSPSCRASSPTRIPT